MKIVLSGLVFLFTFTSIAQETIVISCYRGPWKEVIWDRPNGVFIDSLRANGYNLETAQNIAHYICRNEELVFEPKKAKAALKEIMAETPRDRD